MYFKTLLILIMSTTFAFQSIITYADDYIEEDLSYLDVLEIETSTNLSAEPTLNAKHAVIFDRNSKTVLFGKLENEKCKIASTTKIMTAIITIENCKNLNAIVEVSKNAARNWRF